MTQAINRPTATLTPAKWSLEEFHAIIASGILDDRRVELLSGIIVDMPQGAPNHTACREDVAEYLREKLGATAKVREEAPVTFPSEDDTQKSSEPAPDISVVKSGKYRDRNPYPEDIYLLIEVANTNPQRALEKRLIYAQAGIQEYWILLLAKRELRVFRDIQDGDYRINTVWKEDEISIQVFEDIRLNVNELKDVAFDI